MPKNIEKKLTKLIREFVWNEKKRPVSTLTACVPIKEGSHTLLNISVRNKVIAVMWVKTYLNLGPGRLLWTLIADTLLALNVPITERNVAPEIRQCPFLQSWRTYTSKRSNDSNNLTKILRIARTYSIRLEEIVFDKRILRDCPI